MSSLIQLLDRPIAYNPAFAKLKAGKVKLARLRQYSCPSLFTGITGWMAAGCTKHRLILPVKRR